MLLEDETEEETAPTDDLERPAAWLVSFGDVTALMLTFFVMLFSMSHIQSERWDAVIALVSTSIDPSDADIPRPTSELNIDTVSLVNALPTGYLAKVFREKLERDPVLQAARVTELDEQVVISLPSDVLFDAGRAALRPQADEAIFRLGGVLSQIGNRIDVQGHTAPEAPATDQFASNWSLSLGRALNVANALEEAGYHGSLTAVGLAASQYKHLDPELPEDERFALSRRVDLVILPDADGQ